MIRSILFQNNGDLVLILLRWQAADLTKTRIPLDLSVATSANPALPCQVRLDDNERASESELILVVGPGSIWQVPFSPIRSAVLSPLRIWRLSR